MGKQINYYMGYTDFLKVAQAAIDSGCVIYRHSKENGKWQLSCGNTLDIINVSSKNKYSPKYRQNRKNMI